MRKERSKWFFTNKFIDSEENDAVVDFNPKSFLKYIIDAYSKHRISEVSLIID